MVALYWFKDCLYHPIRVFWLSLAFCVLLMLYDGSFWNWWSLRRNYTEMQARLDRINLESIELKNKISDAQKEAFIQRQATEQLGYVQEGDLVFVFFDGE